MESKVCIKCKESKLLSEYNFNGNGKNLRKKCRKCVAKKNYQISKNKPGWRESRIKVKLKDRYGITLEDYNNLLVKCDFRCSICGLPHTDEKKLNIDHCHNTNIIRGLLCGDYNRGIGLLNDSIDNLLNAIKYLTK